MDKETFLKLVKLNRDFYDNIAQDFSSTRQNYWEGWYETLPNIKDLLNKERIDVLDIGCGNGRFYGFLSENLAKDKLNYLGVDNSEKLLDIAIDSYSKAKFLYKDVILDYETLENNYDLVVAFGITHHLPSREFRYDWYKHFTKLVNKGGLLILTYWQPSKTFKETPPELNKNDLEVGDMFLGWDEKNIDRYVHIYSEEELVTIKNIFKDNDFDLITSFYSDGKNKKSNLYHLYKNRS